MKELKCFFNNIAGLVLIKRTGSLTTFFLIQTFIFTAPVMADSNAMKPVAVDGVIDLSAYDLSQVIALDGQWEFYWNRFIEPKQFATESFENQNYIKVPSNWYQNEIQNQVVPGIGYATHRLRVLLPPDSHVLGIRTNEQSSAYKLYINGELILEDGILAKNREEAVPVNRTRSAFFQTDQQELELVLQISNFHHRSGGPWKSFFLGEAASIENHRTYAVALELFQTGAILLIGLYHIGLFLIRRQAKSALFFGLICLVVVSRILIRGEHFIFEIFPGLGYENFNRAMYAGFMILPPLILYFLRSLYPGEIWKKSPVVVLFIAVLFIAAVIILPTLSFSHLASPYYVVIVLTGIYSIFVVLFAAVRKKEGALLFLAGFLILFATAVNDMLANATSYDSYELLPYGLLVFIFSQSTVLAFRFSRAFSMVENQITVIESQKEQLAGFVRDLEAKVEFRTKELKESNNKLKQANQTKDKFFSIISHDLRGPIGNLSVVFRDIISSPDKLTDELLFHIRSTSGSAYALLEDLLSWSRTQKGVFKVRAENFELIQSIQEAVEIVSLAARNKKIEIQLKNCEDRYVYADRATITTVLRNLLSNAIKFTPETGQITIEAESKDNSIQVSVIDSGVGIPESKKSELFSLSTSRESSPGTANEPGSGLGLVLCKEFVEANQGKIGVESSPGTGSRFWFEIPAGQKAESKESDTDRMRVLLVEDNYMNLQTSMLALKGFDCEVDVAQNGKVAVDKFKSGSFDIIFMDIDMPVMNGIDATRLIKDHKPGQKVVALTSYNQEELISMDSAIRFDGYLKKPLAPIEAGYLFQRENVQENSGQISTEEPEYKVKNRNILLLDDDDSVRSLVQTGIVCTEKRSCRIFVKMNLFPSR